MHLVNPFIFSSGPKSISYVNYTSSIGTSITLPSAIDAGDLLVCFNVARKAAAFATEVIPSGFTKIGGFQDGIYGPVGALTYGYKGLVSVKIATGSEDSTSVNGMNETDTDMTVLQFRPTGFSFTSASNITLGNFTQKHSTGNPSAITSLDTSIKLPSIALGWCASFKTYFHPSFTTESPAFTGTFWNTDSGQTYRQTVAYRLENDVVSNQTVDMGDNGDFNNLLVFHLYDNGL